MKLKMRPRKHFSLILLHFKSKSSDFRWPLSSEKVDSSKIARSLQNFQLFSFVFRFTGT